jgi:hypothetical protein
MSRQVEASREAPDDPGERLAERPLGSGDVVVQRAPEGELPDAPNDLLRSTDGRHRFPLASVRATS